MISIGKWRWPVIVAIPFLVGALLAWRGILRLRYEGKALFTYAGDPKEMEADLQVFRSHADKKVTYEKAPGQVRQAMICIQGTRPGAIAKRLVFEAQASSAEALGRQKAELRKVLDGFQERVLDLDTRYNELVARRKTLLAGPKRNTPRAHLVAKIETLKARRQLLIERYPTHSDIPALAQQIQELASQIQRPAGPVAEKISDLDRQMNEVKLRKDYFSRLLLETARQEQALKPAWTVVLPVRVPQWPVRVEGWPLGASLIFGFFAFGFFLFKGNSNQAGEISAHGLWRPEPQAQSSVPAVTPEPAEAAVQLKVVEPTLPSDPLTEKAGELYGKWIEVAKVLYQPAATAPEGVIDSVGPLLQESTDFLPEGHEVLARYLAHSVEPGNLAAHVARTVLMTLTGAQEAGVSPEHRLAMALAALFHDLAVVPRPGPVQEDVGSEVGRLSATVLRKIPGIEPEILAMVEDILVGMDEFKLETWQNGASGKALEPLSKVLREIDRFEKIMQKQKARLERRVVNQ